MQAMLFVQLQCIVGVQVGLASGWSPAKRTTPTDRNLAGILIRRVGPEVADGEPSLDTNTGPECQVLQEPAGEGIAYEAVDDMATISIQPADGKLLPEEVKVATDEV